MRDPSSRAPLRWPVLLIAVNCAAAAAGVLLWATSRPLASARFEYGVDREFSGVFQRLPYPALANTNEIALLVAPGKHGAGELTRQLVDGARVTLRGSLIERDGRRMVEMAGAVVPGGGGVDGGKIASLRALGHAELQGEIVDSKCFLGVMNPGSGKVHRGCAARCLSGGVPPVLFVRPSKDGTPARYVLLAGEDGGAVAGSSVADFAAEPVRIAGELFLWNEQWLVLRAAFPQAIRRLRE